MITTIDFQRGDNQYQYYPKISTKNMSTKIKQSKALVEKLYQMQQKQKPQSLSNEFISDITQYFKDVDPYPIIITLHKFGYLSYFLQEILDQKINIKEIDIVAICLQVGYNDFLKYFREYEFLQAKKVKQMKNKEEEKNTSEYNSKELVKGLTKYVFNKKIQEYERKMNLLKYINQHLIKSCPHTVFQEIMLNYLKKQLLQKSFSSKDRFCCKLLYYLKQNIQLKDQQDEDYMFVKKFEFPLTNQESKKELLMQSSGFLNGDGGVIYFGLNDIGKQFQVTGYQLKESEKLAFLKSIVKEVVMKIYPLDLDVDTDENEEKIRKDKENEVSKFASKLNEFKLSNFFTLQFIPLCNEKTLLNDSRLYVVKLKIRGGDPYELYHYIDKDQMPVACIREKKNLKILEIQEFCSKAEEKFKDKINEKLIPKKDSFHQYCRINFDCFE